MRSLSPGLIGPVEIPQRAAASLDAIDPYGEDDADFLLAEARPGTRLPVEIANPPRAEPPGKGRPSRWSRRRFAVPPKRLVRLGEAVFAGQGVVLDRDGRRFDLSCPRYGRPNHGGALGGGRSGLTLAAPIELRTRYEGLHLCIGDLPDHFGHLLLETPAKLWPAEWAAKAGARLVALRRGPLGGLQRDLLAAAGVDPDQVLVISEPCVFERLVVPSALLELHTAACGELRQIHERMAQALAPRAAPSAAPRRRVYLSRRGWPAARALLNEGEAEARFAARGFEIVRPETLPLAEQARLAAESEMLAGAMGSQMYLAAFQSRGASVILIVPPGFGLPDDALLARLRNGAARYVYGRADPQFAGRAIDRPFHVDPDDLDAALDRWL